MYSIDIPYLLFFMLLFYSKIDKKTKYREKDRERIKILKSVPFSECHKWNTEKTRDNERRIKIG